MGVCFLQPPDFFTPYLHIDLLIYYIMINMSDILQSLDAKWGEIVASLKTIVDENKEMRVNLDILYNSPIFLKIY